MTAIEKLTEALRFQQELKIARAFLELESIMKNVKDGEEPSDAQIEQALRIIESLNFDFEKYRKNCNTIQNYMDACSDYLPETRKDEDNGD